MADLYVNGRALSTLVASISGVVQLDDAIGGSVPTTATLPIANAGSVFGSTVTLAPRTITATLDVRPSSIIDREAVVDALVLLLAGLLEVSTDAASDRVAYAVLDGRPTMPPAGNLFALPTFDMTCRFLLADPTRYATEPTVLALSTSRVSVPVGTLPSRPRIWLYGNATPIVNPQVIVRSHTGEIVSTLALTGSLGSNTALDIGRTPERIESYSAGVLQTGDADGLTWYDSGAFPILSPDDANPAASAWGTVELAATSGTPTGLLLMRRGW